MVKQKLTQTESDYGCTCDPDKMDGMICCPITNTIELIGKKYTLLILRNMMMGKHSRFNQFLASIKGINPKILSSRLKEMEKQGLVKRTVYHETPLRVENHLTKKGMALKPILKMFGEFSMQYCSKEIFKDGKPRKTSSLNKDHPFRLIK